MKNGYGNCPDCNWFNNPEGCNVERGSKVCLLNKQPIIEKCKICGGEAKIEMYSDGVYACGCHKDYCKSLPFCGAASKEEAIEAWNHWTLNK